MLSLLELLVLGFASYRTTQLIVHDSILDSWRERLELWHARKFDSKIRTFVRDLFGCTYCTGFHASWLTLLTYLLASGKGTGGLSGFLLFGVQAFAVAGVQALLNRFDDTRPEGGH